MFKKLIDVLKAIPAVGVVRVVNYKAGGILTRIYQPMCVLVNYDGIEQVISLNRSVMLNAISRVVKHKLATGHPDIELGVFSHQTYTTKDCIGSRRIDVWTVKILRDGVSYVIALRPNELRDVVAYGLKVSEQVKCRSSKFMRLVRKIGLFIFDR